MRNLRVKAILLFLFGIVLYVGCTDSTSSTASLDIPEEIPEPEPTPSLSDEELMDLVQEQTFKYFWDVAEANSGMALVHSNGSSTTVTIGANGFGIGIASIPAAAERGWITE